jgi:ComF family protein
MLFWGRVPIKYGTALLSFEKGNRTQQILHKIKYKDQRQLARYMGEKLGECAFNQSWSKKVDLIIPVPLHPSKKRKRGYNQSFLLAEGVQKVFGIKIEKHALKRIRANITQTKKNKYERWHNVEEVFNLVDSKKVRNKHVLLIDDAITTGATLEACVRALQQAKNCEISIATLAIAK